MALGRKIYPPLIGRTLSLMIGYLGEALKMASRNVFPKQGGVSWSQRSNSHNVDFSGFLFPFLVPLYYLFFLLQGNWFLYEQYCLLCCSLSVPPIEDPHRLTLYSRCAQKPSTSVPSYPDTLHQTQHSR